MHDYIVLTWKRPINSFILVRKAGFQILELTHKCNLTYLYYVLWEALIRVEQRRMVEVNGQVITTSRTQPPDLMTESATEGLVLCDITENTINNKS